MQQSPLTPFSSPDPDHAAQQTTYQRRVPVRLISMFDPEHRATREQQRDPSITKEEKGE